MVYASKFMQGQISNHFLLIAAAQVQVAFGHGSSSYIRSFGNTKSVVTGGKNEGATLNIHFLRHVLFLLELPGEQSGPILPSAIFFLIQF